MPLKHTLHVASVHSATEHAGESVALQISAYRSIETEDVAFDELPSVFQKDASALADAMFAALPGGTIDALISEFLRRRASLFVVPFNSPAKS